MEKFRAQRLEDRLVHRKHSIPPFKVLKVHCSPALILIQRLEEAPTKASLISRCPPSPANMPLPPPHLTHASIFPLSSAFYFSGSFSHHTLQAKFFFFYSLSYFSLPYDSCASLDSGGIY